MEVSNSKILIQILVIDLSYLFEQYVFLWQ